MSVWSNSFRCGDGSCIDASTQRCNGVAECADSSDEADCVIHDMMTPGTTKIGAGQNLISCNSASDPTLAIVCGVVFPILALAIIFSVVLIRKSQGLSVLAPTANLHSPQCNIGPNMIVNCEVKKIGSICIRIKCQLFFI
ncbi:uncharacterized protein LOC124189868 [Daphnia pulex]|uniref:uncharacterized protein LOC124189868 n=1 Tax=Daphnia pulex TaxID=6669 RepID=UPI001EE113BF|nr:uncharacterized protein LOC124189868 [Daphnia pulex]XP_046438306.1 uncharacterized protein LOC124189868 [Daphnia pulex]